MSSSQNKKTRIYVALSGGVDSAVAAALLKQAGYDVTGVFFKPWQPSKGLIYCTWKEDRQSALRVAAVLGIPFKTWDLSKEYKKSVADYMINTYRHGLTPNPDVMCNKEIKFGVFLKRALKEGADFIATGHYARREPEFKISNLKFKIRLLRGTDPNKDQSYFLWTLTQKQLQYCLFPVGDLLKPAVRRLAKKFKLPNYARKDSQGVCFIGPLDMATFLKSYIPPRAGKIVDQAGKVVGEHSGATYYTIGQRHGLDIKNGQGPYFVTRKDLKKNVVYVTTDEKQLEQAAKAVLVEKLSWVGEAPTKKTKLTAVARYRSGAVPIKLTSLGKTKLTLQFKKPVRALTPGQSIVFYRGEEVVGGGVIGG